MAMTLRDAFMSGYMEAREQVLSETLPLLLDSTRLLIYNAIEVAANEAADKYFPMATEGELTTETNPNGRHLQTDDESTGRFHS